MLCAAEPCPKSDVPVSAVSTFGLPEMSKPSLVGENQEPVASEMTPGIIVSLISKVARQEPLEFQILINSPSEIPLSFASEGS